MSANNNNPQKPQQGSAPSPFGVNPGMASASVPGNQGFTQSHMAPNFPAQFQFSQAQAMAHAQAQAQSKAQAQFQAQMQAGMTMNQGQGSQGIGGVLGSSSPSMTPGSLNMKRFQQRPPMRPPSGFPASNNTVSPMRTMELTPAARKKKMKLPEKSLQERVAAILPESALYTQLLEFESRVDAALSRKKVDIQEALKNPPCTQKTLRIYVFNSFANQNNTIPGNPNADPPTWTLKIVGRILEDGVDPDQPGFVQQANPSHPKFSSFFKKVIVNLDQRLYPENSAITWESARSPAPQEGFEIKRKGNQEFAATIRLEMNYVPEKFKLSTALMDVLGIEVETRPRIISAIWHYVKARKLQNPNDPSFFNCDTALHKVFGEEKVKFTMVSQKISHHLSPPPPIHLEHKIKLSGNNPAISACYDVLVDVPFPIQRDLNNLLANAEKNKEIEACDEAICAAIRKIHEHRRRRAFFLGFSQSPVEFINALIESQSKDLKVVAGEASRNAEKERRADFFNQPWRLQRSTNKHPSRLQEHYGCSFTTVSLVYGCDASVLIASDNGDAEKDAHDNISLAGDGFDTVAKAKLAVEAQCPDLVSCADILALAARDVVVLAGGPGFMVELGRRDGLVSHASSVDGKLPGPELDVTGLVNLFANNGLSITDMIALSGAHTIGFSHCDRFAHRLYNFSALMPIDPTLDPAYAQQLMQTCPRVGSDPNSVSNLDATTPDVFDNAYFLNLVARKGLFTSDQVLFNDFRSQATVVRFANNAEEFNNAFTSAMRKLGRVGVKVGNRGEIRKDCAAFN
ncbi:hypothetical protein DY000_02019024 [Brassica cretica]|uniref:peroxidase n=1 Tax=Brassica cretica TaxID=69181 RepID=A0ABQ7CT63_BRACR|nr:hypothetical protein DY000_02019024 [Brassica cretica]